MAKATTKTSTKSVAKSVEKPARSKTRAAAKPPRAVRKTVKPKAPVAKVATPKSAPIDAQVEPRNELSKKELVERIARDTDMKKGDARRALEAVLAAMRDTLAEGTDMSVAPLGKIKVARTKDTPTGKLVVCRIKLKTASAD